MVARPEGFEPPTLGLEVRSEGLFDTCRYFSLGAFPCSVDVSEELRLVDASRQISSSCVRNVSRSSLRQRPTRSMIFVEARVCSLKSRVPRRLPSTKTAAYPQQLLLPASPRFISFKHSSTSSSRASRSALSHGDGQARKVSQRRNHGLKPHYWHVNGLQRQLRIRRKGPSLPDPRPRGKDSTGGKRGAGGSVVEACDGSKKTLHVVSLR